jgi:hypothetical protein
MALLAQMIALLIARTAGQAGKLLGVLLILCSSYLLLTPFLGSISLFIDLFVKQSTIPWWEWLIGALTLLILASFLVDEMQPHIEDGYNCAG